MVIFLSSVILVISDTNGLIPRRRKEGKSKQCRERKGEATGIVEDKRAILKNKDKRKKGGDRSNKIGHVNKSFEQKILSVDICNLVKSVDFFSFISPFLC